MSEKNTVLQFDLTPRQIKFKDILNKEFVEMEIYAISDIDPNRNKSHFTLESMERVVANGSIKNKPIVGFFKNQDFTTHEGYADYDIELGEKYWNTERGERILGWVRESDPVELVEEDGLHWIKFRCVLCVRYCYSQVKRLLKDRRKKVSVEITVHKSEEREDGVIDLLDWTLNGTTILGSKNGKEVLEGVPGAHLSILENLDDNAMMEQRKMLSFAYEQAFGADENKLDDDSKTKIEESELGFNPDRKEEEKLENKVIIDGVEDFAKDDIGTKSALKVDKSKEAMSEKPWGEVDKSELRKRVIAAENFKSIADDIFLDLREGWEDGIEGALKYPVMCLEGEKAVYNRGGLASAKAYAEKNGENAILEKLEKIYKHLELDEGEEEKEAAEHCDFCEDYECEEPKSESVEECKMDGDCKCPETDGLEMTEGKPVEECKMDDDHDDDDHDEDPDDKDDKDDNKDDGCPCEEHEECGEKEEAEACKTEEATAVEEEECDELCKLSKRCAELEAKCEEYCGTIARMEEECKLAKEDAEKFREYSNKLENEARARFNNDLKVYAESIMENEKIEKADYDKILEKCECGEYASNDEVMKDVAVAAFKVKEHPVLGAKFSSPISRPTFGIQKSEDSRLKTPAEKLAVGVKRK
uniref:Prohead protease n=1 Tax=Siphoviridae sp. ctnpt50 TaxID=2827941 RepID=A0A8S5SEE4_9CAUD|nr:MAG TPA: hypothetical protein [Siphoviridae sp. ctnpt50]